MRGIGVGIDDDHGLLLVTRSTAQRLGQHRNGAEIEYDLVDDVMALRIDADIDLKR